MFEFFSKPQNVLHRSSKVSMHAMTIIGPTLLKVGYVMRLLAQYRLETHPVGAMA